MSEKSHGGGLSFGTQGHSRKLIRSNQKDFPKSIPDLRIRTENVWGGVAASVLVILLQELRRDTAECMIVTFDCHPLP